MDDNPERNRFTDFVKKGFSSIRPGFLGGKNEEGFSGGVKRNDSWNSKSQEGNTGAVQDLRRAEGGASGTSPNQTEDSLVGTKQAETPAMPSFYTGSGRKELGKGKGLKISVKKIAPALVILGAVSTIGIMMGGAQTLMPFAIQEMIIEKFNSVGFSSSMASDELLDTQLNQGVRVETLKGDETENIFAFSDYQVKEFEKQGIKVIDDIDIGSSGLGGAGIVALLYNKEDNYIPVVGSDFLGKSNLVSAIKSASGLDNIGSPVSAKTALSDQAFRFPYMTASKTWRGGSSGWFDEIMDNVTTTKLGIKRNRWARFVAGVADDAKEKFNEIAKGSSESAKDEGVASVKEDTETVEEDGTTTERTTTSEVDTVDVEGGTVDGVEVKGGEVDVESTSTRSGQTAPEIEATLNNKALKSASAVAGAGDVAMYGCALIEGLITVYTTLSAYQSLQFLNLISGYLEAVSKVKAGDGNGSPVHEYNENLTTVGDTTNAEGKVVRSGTAMDSAGMSWLFSKNSPIDPNDQSVTNVNFESIMSNTSKLFSNIALTSSVYEKCGYVKAGAAVVNLGLTVLSFFGPGAVFKVAQIGLKEVGKIVVSASVQAALYIIIPIAAKNLAQMMIKDTATEWFGEDLGNAMISGANKYLGGNGTSGGQSPGSPTKVAQYMGERDTVLAEQAEYERATRSPFDATSQYTFMGNLAYSLMPLAFSGRGVTSLLSKTSSLASSSLVAMLPTASAIDEQSVLTSTGKCDLLNSTGAVGDAFCNPYIITDVSTMGLSGTKINEIVYRLDNSSNELASVNLKAGISSDNFNENGSIKDDSNLAKYITYCGQRISQYGIKDAAVYDSVVGGGGAKSLLGLVPVISDFTQLADAAKEEWNMSWINGSACVASEENPKWDSEFKYYQRYAEQQRLLENMNPGYKSPVALYLEKYYQENPVDQSFEGQLARFSGLPKEKVEEALALIDYYNFLENYDPSERYAFNGSGFEIETGLNFDNENRLAGAGILLDEIIYTDVRNRSFAV